MYLVTYEIFIGHLELVRHQHRDAVEENGVEGAWRPGKKAGGGAGIMTSTYRLKQGPYIRKAHQSLESHCVANDKQF